MMRAALLACALLFASSSAWAVPGYNPPGSGGGGAQGPAGPQGPPGLTTNATTTAIGGVQISAGVAALGGTPTLHLLGTAENLNGLAADSATVVPPSSGGYAMSLANAVSRGDIRIDDMPGYHGDARTAQCAVTYSGAVITIGACNGNAPAFTAADVGRHIAIDSQGVTPTTGPISGLAITAGGTYGQTGAFPVATLANAGSGTGFAAPPPIMAVQSVTLVTQGSGCPTGTLKLAVAGGGYIPTFVSIASSGGSLTDAVGTVYTVGSGIITNPEAGADATGYWDENPPASTDTFPLAVWANTPCAVPPTVQLTFTIAGWSDYQPGAGYPSSTTYTISGGSPTTAPTPGAVTELLAAPPNSTTISGFTSATTVTLATAPSTVTGAAKEDILIGDDDSPAYNQAVAVLQARQAIGAQSMIFFPPNRITEFVTATHPIAGSGGILGGAMSFKSVVDLDPSFSGNVFDCDDATIRPTGGVSNAWGANTANLSNNVAGCLMKGLSVVGWQDSPNVINAFAVSGQSQFARLEDLDAMNVPGACMLLGAPDAGDTNSAFEESMVDHVRCRLDGSIGTSVHPAVEITSTGSQSSNTDFFSDVTIYAPLAPCISVHDEGTGVGQQAITFNAVRCESGTGKFGSAQPSDLIDIGSIDGHTPESNAGSESRLSFTDTMLISMSPGYAGVKIIGAPNPAPTGIHANIDFYNILESGGATQGPALDIDNCKNCTFTLTGGAFSNNAFPVVVGPAGSGTAAVQQLFIVPDRSVFANASNNITNPEWLDSVAASSDNQVSFQQGVYGDPMNPQTGGSAVQGALTAYGGLKLPTCAGYLYGNSGAGVSCSPTLSVASSVSAKPANGTTLGSAATLLTTIVYVNSGTGGVRPLDSGTATGACYQIYNLTGAAINVYPGATGDTINLLAAGTARSLPSGLMATECKLTATSYGVSIGG
jgi:hypothetical protein